MNRTVLFLLVILATADIFVFAAAKKPDGPITAAKLPGIVDTKPPVFAVKSSTPTKTDTAEALAPTVTGQAVLSALPENKATAAPSLPKTIPDANSDKSKTTAPAPVVTASTAPATAPQAAPIQKKESIPLASLENTTQEDAAPVAKTEVPAVPVPSAPAGSASSLMVKSTQQAVIEKTEEPAEKTAPPIKSVLLAPEPTAQMIVPEEDASVAELTSKTTEVQERDIAAGTTAEATLQAGTTTEQKPAPEITANAPAKTAMPAQQDLTPKTTQETLPQSVLSKEPAANPKENTVSRIPAPPKGVSAKAVLPPLPVSRPVLKKEEPKDTSRETLVRAYRVAAGDTLPLLAERYYGDKSEWVRIYEANKDRIEKGSLQKGQILIIP